MKKNIFFIFVLIAITTYASSEKTYANHTITEAQNKINMIAHKAIVKKLNLNGEQKKRVLDLLITSDTEKCKALDELVHLKEELQAKEQQQGTSDFVIADLIKQIDSKRKEISQIEQSKQHSLSGFLSQQQMADYLILMKKMDDKLMESVHTELKNSH